MGDRVQQIVDGETTTYTLDTSTALSASLASGLTQVLSDGTNDYIYGLGRIAQFNADAEYFLSDALGSVRQLTDADGIVTLAQSYQPYGDLLSSAGSAASSYGFTGEMTDPSGLIYLRARYYHPSMGRFLTRDPWEGDYNSPMSYNPWVYGYGNPVNMTDPSGRQPSYCYYFPLDMWGSIPGCESTPSYCYYFPGEMWKSISGCPGYCPPISIPFPIQNFDPQLGPTNLPITNWTYWTDKERLEKSGIVLDWLTYYEGTNSWWKEGGTVSGLKIGAFILQREPGELWLVNLSEQEGRARDIYPSELMARVIRDDLTKGPLSVGKLARYTCFFDPIIRPKSDEKMIFTLNDWNELLKEPYPDVQSVIINATQSPEGVRYWWRENEIKWNKENRQFEYRYLLPKSLGLMEYEDEFFFGTREQFEYHGIGR